jgi:8-oxo-dGTP pyrophosphatase MutT (NUDIX family)
MMQPVAATSSSSGIPAGAREADDMKRGDWDLLVGELMKFFGEEAREPEHAEDADHMREPPQVARVPDGGHAAVSHHVKADPEQSLDEAGPRTLFAKRPLKNGDVLAEWARGASFENVYAPEKMHVTLAWSGEPLAWPEAAGEDVSVPDANDPEWNGTRSVERLGDEGAIVLRFASPEIEAGWRRLKDVGAVWKHADFKPHVTFTLDGGDVDLGSVEPYAGPLDFGPEEFAEVDEDWVSKARGAADDDAKHVGAGVMLTEPGGKVLFLKRGERGDHPGHWDFPGGGAEAGESPEETAAREAAEETGRSPNLPLKLVGKGAPSPAPLSPQGGSGAYFATFSAPVESEFEPKLDGEHVAHAWAHPSEAPSPLHPGVASTLALMGQAADAAEIKVDADHDGPWLSCMSKDGGKMYKNRKLPKRVEIKGKDVDVADVLQSHEVPEWKDIERLVEDFKSDCGREPNRAERIAIYKKAHARSGTPSERAHCEREGIDWDAWSAWCRGMEAEVEKGPFENEPADADIKPIRHGHSELGAAIDSALHLALDRSSVRMIDKDGRLHVEEANICKACVSPYRGKEIPGWDEESQTHDLGLDPDRIYMMLRPPEELEKAFATSNGVQLLRKHVPVNADDHKPYDTVGSVGTSARWEDPYVKNALTVWPAADIGGVESKKKVELSPGYHYKPVMRAGTFKGQYYDGKMVDIEFNHVAIVEEGRQGPDVVIGDAPEEVDWMLLEQAIVDLCHA